MRRAHGSKGSLHKFKKFLYSMPELETGELKLTGHMTHVFAGSGEQIYAALREFLSLSLREIGAIAHYDPVLHPAREGIKQLAIIDGGSGQIKATEPSGFVALDVELEAVPPAHAVLRFTSPLPKGTMLVCPRDVTDGDRGGVLQHDRIRALRLAITTQHQSQQCPQLDTIPIRRLDKFAVRPERWELSPMIRLDVKINWLMSLIGA
jgi:hypothetical protein